MSRNPLDDPIFWREFLKKLSFLDPDHDAEVTASLCETFNLDAEEVAARIKAVYVPGLH